MLSKSVLGAATAVFATVGMAAAADLPSKKGPEVALAPFFLVNDNAIGFSYQWRATDPGALRPSLPKKVLSFSHFDVWAYGTNFFAVDLLKSTHADPAVCIPAVPCAGATEVYGLFRSTLGFNQLFGTKAFTMGPLNNVSFEFGADMNTKNQALAPAKKLLVAGLKFDFDLPAKANLSIAPLVAKEWSHNAFYAGVGNDGNVDFNTTWRVDVSYGMPLSFIWDPLSFSGSATWIGPKGTGNIANNVKTVTEFNSEQRLTLDAGKLIGGASKSHFLDVYVAYRYWQNKFGLNHSVAGPCVATPGSCTESTLITGANIKF